MTNYFATYMTLLIDHALGKCKCEGIELHPTDKMARVNLLKVLLQNHFKARQRRR